MDPIGSHWISCHLNGFRVVSSVLVCFQTGTRPRMVRSITLAAPYEAKRPIRNKSEFPNTRSIRNFSETRPRQTTSRPKHCVLRTFTSTRGFSSKILIPERQPRKPVQCMSPELKHKKAPTKQSGPSSCPLSYSRVKSLSLHASSHDARSNLEQPLIHTIRK